MTKKGFLTGAIGFTPPRGRGPRQDIPERDFGAERKRLLESLAKQSPATRLHLKGKFKPDTSRED